ncbi:MULTISPECIES: hormogonium polysaccharide biosynthesis glycosyltransferase HpsO [Cyanophyceae]|uniref:hormogonium polysaccharide biosynthesis glycosyltransferase HpsO n=1 Tax=Cyanophyceae TaxID=3028117 RepID=UPI001688D865|nr:MULTISPECIES: hormogonium polysaccharide biosynthesis glycosyltransferase HpsO [Cyanophyceae]MBD1918739.1 glycosyltransferase family 4 protein [Phormidium sp. FACHB-77]MBD2033392.1 glycosyltransferase family 4 protein [Phormidium sp. FACHB-322]MBD2053891.1 glycosyltransferase family 4 protein [Leptolyngbya sp. FACHB-60]
MRVLVLSHTYIVDLNREKLRALAQLSPEMEVVVGVPQRWQPGGVQNRLIVSEPLRAGNFRVQPLSNLSQNNQGLLTFGPDLIRLLQKFRPQVIQVEQGAKALGYAQTITLNRLLGLRAKNVLFTWWNLPYQLKFPISALEAYNLRHTHGLVVGNQDGANVLRDRGYIAPYRVMPQLGVDETLFRPQPQPELAQSLAIASDAFVVGYCGRFVEEKGLLTLCAALTTLRDQPQPWVWLLVGRGELRDTIQAKADGLGIGDRLRWVTGIPHDQVPNYINLMHTLVLPSETTEKFKTLTAKGWKEQFGHVLIEAMACAVPVIGSDSGEIPHVIDQAGLVFPEGNAPALAEHLRLLMENPARRQSLGESGYYRAMGRYTNRALAKQLLEFYEEIGVR